MGYVLIGVGWLTLGATCVAWRAQSGFGVTRPTDIEGMAVLLLWPAWVISEFATRYGWRNR